jgi:hypothetical protein
MPRGIGWVVVQVRLGIDIDLDIAVPPVRTRLDLDPVAVAVAIRVMPRQEVLIQLHAILLHPAFTLAIFTQLASR